ncbi:hypothetical protein CYMTET_19497 [Cymbomonas tetramitiformis]|uniref:Uncharacterized protein n=1 Tax=Cymbomonas tetramitiformis TaxID=36881 RepID=A0AAE0G618_9CHLO|nr:hypothetical protein CYMTET_19497 [Cymbomonas tetramitiformis]
MDLRVLHECSDAHDLSSPSPGGESTSESKDFPDIDTVNVEPHAEGIPARSSAPRPTVKFSTPQIHFDGVGQTLRCAMLSSVTQGAASSPSKRKDTRVIRETLSEILDDEQRRMPYGDLDTQIRRVLATHPRTQQVQQILHTLKSKNLVGQKHHPQERSNPHASISDRGPLTPPVEPNPAMCSSPRQERGRLVGSTVKDPDSAQDQQPAAERVKGRRSQPRPRVLRQRSKELPPLPRAIRDQPPLVATAPVVVVDNEVQTVVAALADLEFKDGHGGTDAQQVLQSAALQVQHMLDEQLQREQRESLQTQEKALASAVPIISVVQTGMFDDVNLSPWEEEDLTHPTMLQDHNEMCQYANHNAVHQVDIAIPSVQHTSESLDLSQSNAKVRLWLEPMNDVYVTQQATPPPVPRQDAEEALRSPKDIGGNGQLVVEKPPRSRGSEEDARSQLRIPSNVIQELTVVLDGTFRQSSQAKSRPPPPISPDVLCGKDDDVESFHSTQHSPPGTPHIATPPCTPIDRPDSATPPLFSPFFFPSSKSFAVPPVPPCTPCPADPSPGRSTPVPPLSLPLPGYFSRCGGTLLDGVPSRGQLKGELAKGELADIPWGTSSMLYGRRQQKHREQASLLPDSHTHLPVESTARPAEGGASTPGSTKDAKEGDHQHLLKSPVAPLQPPGPRFPTLSCGSYTARTPVTTTTPARSGSQTARPTSTAEVIKQLRCPRYQAGAVVPAPAQGKRFFHTRSRTLPGVQIMSDNELRPTQLLIMPLSQVPQESNKHVQRSAPEADFRRGGGMWWALRERVPNPGEDLRASSARHSDMARGASLGRASGQVDSRDDVPLVQPGLDIVEGKRWRLRPAQNIAEEKRIYRRRGSR